MAKKKLIFEKQELRNKKVVEKAAKVKKAAKVEKRGKISSSTKTTLKKKPAETEAEKFINLEPRSATALMEVAIGDWVVGKNLLAELKD